MNKLKQHFLQYLRFIVQALFVLGLWFPIIPSSEIIGQQIFLTIFFVGVFFCGWCCPFGTLQEWIASFARHLKIPRFYPPQKIQFILQFSRYIFLVLTFMGYTFVLLKGRSIFVHQLFIGTLTGVSITILIGFILLSLFIDRPFCNYFCTMGALYGLCSPLRLFSIKRNPKACVHCHLCDKTCPMHICIEKNNFVRHPNCINCMKCIERCPKQCLAYRFVLPRNYSAKDTTK